tara:strand:- start:1688 stop:2368 length:681 start_codon:yes stop_codon:yes gene_type:complete
MNKTKKQLVISIGTGRSGSVSLSNFLSHQNSMRILHEGRIEEKSIRKLLKWEGDEDELFAWLDYLHEYNIQNSFIGDTGMYYLPYISKIIEKYPNVKIIGLTRLKEEVVNSYLNKTKGRNHWYKHNGKDWKIDKKWDLCFPKYNEPNKKRSIELYWEEYKLETEKLELIFPSNVKIWTIEEFNTISGKNKILDFIGYKLVRDTNSNFKLNQIEKESFLQKLKRKWF